MKDKKWIKIFAVISFISILILPSMVSAENNSNAEISIKTTMAEAQDIINILKKRGYDVANEGELIIKAEFENSKTLSEKNLKVIPAGVKDIRKPLIFGICIIAGFLLGGLVIKGVIKRRAEKDLYDFSPVNLSSRIAADPMADIYDEYNAYCNQKQQNSEGPIVEKKRDYSRYDDSNQSVFIRQRTMYYK